MIIFHYIYNLYHKDFGDVIIYLFAKEEVVSIEADEFSLQVEEYNAAKNIYDITKLNQVVVWQLCKFFLFGCDIINLEERCHSIKRF
jgi:hypothetical protein